MDSINHKWYSHGPQSSIAFHIFNVFTLRSHGYLVADSSLVQISNCYNIFQCRSSLHAPNLRYLHLSCIENFIDKFTLSIKANLYQFNSSMNPIDASSSLWSLETDHCSIISLGYISSIRKSFSQLKMAPTQRFNLVILPCAWRLGGISYFWPHKAFKTLVFLVPDHRKLHLCGYFVPIPKIYPN